MATAQPPTDIHEATAVDVAAAGAAAAAAAPLLAALSLAERAGLLRAAADTLDAHSAELVKLADAETSLGEARLTGEVARTTGQLRLLADQAAAGAYLDLIETPADPA
uniref:aldehyde dehydrogenase family protein n=1 Tax=Peterkaempfera griseoplana TaxID=66896 RepID=UPI000A8AE250